MFDISWAKLLVIGVVALIFIGPKELPEIMHTLGKTLGKLRRSADDFRRQFEDSMHEAGYKDLHKNLEDFRSLNPANQLKAGIEKALLAEPTANRTIHQQPAQGAESGPTVSAEKTGAHVDTEKSATDAPPAAHLNGALHPKPADPLPGNPV